MGMHLYYLNRNIDATVMKALVELIHNCDLNSKIITTSQYFQSFITASFAVKREVRPSVSQLSDMFRQYNCTKPGTLATEYAKQLESLADEKSVENFRV